MLRRLFWLGLLGGAGFAGYSAWRHRAETPSGLAPEWPPFEPRPAPVLIDSADQGDDEPAAETASAAAAAAETSGDGASSAPRSSHDAPPWMPAIDGRCPDGYPIKANDSSRIFHVPGGRFYDRTVPERCYADAADAEADGYRRAKA
jgi:hypothetical protein